MRNFLLLSMFFVCLSFCFSTWANTGFVVAGHKKSYWRPAYPPPSYFKAFPPGFDPFFVRLSSEETTVTIENKVADVFVKQNYYNMSSDTTNAYYLLPIPEGAKFDDFTVKVGEFKARPEFMAADQACVILQELVKRTNNTVFLQYCGQDFYKIALYNVLPRDSKDIEVSYKQRLSNENDLTKFDYQFSPKAFSSPSLRSCKFDLTIKESNRISNMYCTTHDLDYKQEEPNTLTFSFNGVQKRDLSFYYTTTDKHLGYSLFTYKEPNEEGYFYLTFDAGHLEPENIVAKDIVFVVDASAAMNGKLKSVQSALATCIDMLNPNDRFNVVSFAASAKMAFPEWKKVSESSKSAANTFIKSISAGGAGSYEAALNILLKAGTEKVRPYIAYWITGAAPKAGLTDIDNLMDKIEDANVRTLRIFSMGLGVDNNPCFLDQFCDYTNGFTRYSTGNAGNYEKDLVDFFAQINNPVLANMQLYFSKNFEVTDMYPRKPDNFFSEMPLTMVGRYPKGGEIEISLLGDISEQMRRFNFKANFVSDDQSYSFVPQLWAARRVGALMNDVRIEGTDQDIEDEMLKLCKEHNLINPYSIYLEMTEIGKIDEEKKAFLPAFYTHKDNNYQQQFENLEAEEGPIGIMSSRDAYTMLQATEPANLRIGQDRMHFNDAKGKIQKNAINAYWFLNGEYIYLANNGYWLQASTQDTKVDDITEIQVNTDDYYNVLKNNIRLGKLLSLGNKVQFEANGKVYKTTDPEPIEWKED